MTRNAPYFLRAEIDKAERTPPCSGAFRVRFHLIMCPRMNDAERTLRFGTGKMPVLQEMAKKNFFGSLRSPEGKENREKGKRGKG
jgi:hypothetical protein